MDIDKLRKTIEDGKYNRDSLKKRVEIEGEWQFDKEYQFSALLSYEKGKQVVEIDSPSFLGGNGSRVGPMHYCVLGMTSCFLSTLVSIAALQGIKFNKLKVKSYCLLNLAKTFDISNEPIIESINIEIDTLGERLDKAKLEELVEMAKERCPAIYAMTHVIKPNVTIK